MHLPPPDREREGQRAAQDGRPQRDLERPEQRGRVGAAQERGEHLHREGAEHQADHRDQPGGELAEDDLGVGQVGRHDLHQRPARLVQADRAGRRRRGGQEQQRQLDEGDRPGDGAAERGDLAQVHPVGPPGLRLPEHEQAAEDHADERRAGGVQLPPPRGPQPLVREHRAERILHRHATLPGRGDPDLLRSAVHLTLVTGPATPRSSAGRPPGRPEYWQDA